MISVIAFRLRSETVTPVVNIVDSLLTVSYITTRTDVQACDARLSALNKRSFIDFIRHAELHCNISCLSGRLLSTCASTWGRTSLYERMCGSFVGQQSPRLGL